MTSDLPPSTEKVRNRWSSLGWVGSDQSIFQTGKRTRLKVKNKKYYFSQVCVVEIFTRGEIWFTTRLVVAFPVGGFKCRVPFRGRDYFRCGREDLPGSRFWPSKHYHSGQRRVVCFHHFPRTVNVFPPYRFHLDLMMVGGGYLFQSSNRKLTNNVRFDQHLLDRWWTLVPIREWSSIHIQRATTGFDQFGQKSNISYCKTKSVHFRESFLVR